MRSPCAVPRATRPTNTTYQTGQTRKVRDKRARHRFASSKATPEAVRLTAMNGTARKADSGAETILLVDDDETVRVLVYKSLKQQGYTVLQARLNSQPLIIARRHDGPIHMILADVMMHGINAREFAYMLAS